MASVIYTSRGGVIADAWRDLAEALLSWRIWTSFAWEEFKNRYRRSYLGVVWVVAQFLLFCTMIALFFGDSRHLTGDGPPYAVHVFAGFLSFSFIMACMVDACSVFIGAENWLKSARAPFTLFVLKGVTRNFFSFLYNAVVTIIVVFVIFHVDPTPALVMLVPAVAVYLINAFWLYFIFGLIAARVRDFAHFVQAIMRLMLFLTPIIWVPGDMGGVRGLAAAWNPLAHYVEIIRQPLIAGDPGYEHWLWVAPITVIGCVGAFIAFALSRRRIMYWLQA